MHRKMKAFKDTRAKQGELIEIERSVSSKYEALSHPSRKEFRLRLERIVE
jgi:hypothetical protein